MARKRRNESKILAIEPKSRTITGLEKAEFKQIGDYLKGPEEGLYKWDYRGVITLGHLAAVKSLDCTLTLGPTTTF